MSEMNTIKTHLACGPIIIFECLTLNSVCMSHPKQISQSHSVTHSTPHYRQQQLPHVGSSIPMEWIAWGIFMGHFIVSPGLQVCKPKNGAHE